MSDYTPTTEEVLQEVIKKSLVDSWRNMHTNESYGLQEMLAYYATHAIQPVLAEVKTAQDKETNDRIIALLKAKLTTAKELFDDSDGFESHVGNQYSGMIMAYETAIDLIKGEEQ